VIDNDVIGGTKVVFPIDRFKGSIEFVEVVAGPMKKFPTHSLRDTGAHLGSNESFPGGGETYSTLLRFEGNKAHFFNFIP